MRPNISNLKAPCLILELVYNIFRQNDVQMSVVYIFLYHFYRDIG